ncbi:TetR/AcrR family transcriptional regulator [Nonomuraea typhae]|uniref:TetR/AcrR family transcriptional regulator n=1 Tax=Nonomuraea typhae TaxID=2603600 RepID=UPI0012FC0B8A|nr:TetR/AcrR family transcriptional regulator [Nonomuraea typhae]
MAMSHDEIVNAAIRHLNMVPAASMAEIAQAAGISRATLHRHFSTRDDLLHEMGVRAMDSWAHVHESVGLSEGMKAGLDADGIKDLLDRLLIKTLDSIDEHGFALTENALSGYEDLVRRAEELEKVEIALFAAAQRAGVLRAELPVRWVSNTVYGLLVAIRDSLRRGDVARRDIPTLFLDTFYRGTS